MKHKILMCCHRTNTNKGHLESDCQCSWCKGRRKETNGERKWYLGVEHCLQSCPKGCKVERQYGEWIRHYLRRGLWLWRLAMLLSRNSKCRLVVGLTFLLEIIGRLIFTSIPTWRLLAHQKWTSITQMVMICVFPSPLHLHCIYWIYHRGSCSWLVWKGNHERGGCQCTQQNDSTGKNGSSVLDCHLKYQNAFCLEERFKSGKNGSSVMDCHLKYQNAFWLEERFKWLSNKCCRVFFILLIGAVVMLSQFMVDSSVMQMRQLRSLLAKMCKNEALNYCTLTSLVKSDFVNFRRACILKYEGTNRKLQRRPYNFEWRLAEAIKKSSKQKTTGFADYVVPKISQH